VYLCLHNGLKVKINEAIEDYRIQASFSHIRSFQNYPTCITDTELNLRSTLSQYRSSSNIIVPGGMTGRGVAAMSDLLE